MKSPPSLHQTVKYKKVIKLISRHFLDTDEMRRYGNSAALIFPQAFASHHSFSYKQYEEEIIKLFPAIN